MKEKYFRKIFKLVLISVLMLNFMIPMSLIGATTLNDNFSVNCSKCPVLPDLNDNNMGITKPLSNVKYQDYDNILSHVVSSPEYKQLQARTSIGGVNSSDIIINEFKSKNNIDETAASVEFIIGENVQDDNLAYVQLVYDLTEDRVLLVKKLYTALNEDGTANLRMVMNDEEVFSMNINDKGEIIDENDKIVSQDQFYKKAVDNLSPGQSQTKGWCHWVVGALCGGVGTAGCYGAAIALGVTTGVGGLALSVVCGMIGSLGCTAATNKICK